MTNNNYNTINDNLYNCIYLAYVLYMNVEVNGHV